MDNTASYYKAIRQHNLATGNDTEEARDLWDRVSDSVANIPSFTQATLASTLIGFHNTGTMIGNWTRSKENQSEYIDTQKWLSEYDENLGKYYRENASAVDTAGFVVGSLVPGGAGIKALNVGQKALSTAKATGVIGGNMSRATGLLVPRTQTYVARAAENIAATNTKHRILQADTVKTLASGVHQNVLEAAAFETFALAAQYNSNFIQDVEGKDIVKNMLTGVALGGALGGAISGVVNYRKITQGVKAFDAQGNAGLIQKAAPKALPEDLKMSLAFSNRANTEATIAQLEAKLAQSSGPEAAIISRHIENAKGTVTDLNNQILEQTMKVSVSRESGKRFADAIRGMASDDAASWIVGVKKLGRATEFPTPKAPRSKQGKLDLGFPETQKALAGEDKLWHKLWGEDAGSTAAEAPSITKLADRVKLKRGESIDAAIDRVAGSFKFSAKRGINIMDSKLNLNEVQARWAWAEKVKLKGDVSIQELDLPLLEAALKQFDTIGGEVKVVNAQGEVIIKASSVQSLEDTIVQSKAKAVKQGLERKMPPNLIAEHTNVKSEYIKGTAVSQDRKENLFAWQYWADKEGKSVRELMSEPSWMGAQVDKRLVSELSDAELSAELFIAQQLKVHQDSVDNAIAYATSVYKQLELEAPGLKGVNANLNVAEALPENRVFQEHLQTANRYGSGSGLITSANGNYGSLESVVQRIGMIKHEMDKRGISIVQAEFDSVGRALMTDKRAAAEVSAVNEILAGRAERYGVVPNGPRDAPAGTVLQLRPLRELDGRVSPGEVMPEPVNVSNPIAARMIETHMKLNSQRVSSKQVLRQSEGLDFIADPRAYYPIKPDPRTTPFYAFVKDGTATGGTRTTMIHAATAKELDTMIRKTKEAFPDYKIVTKGKSEDYYRALGEYDYNKTLNELDLDSALISRGINSQQFPVTEPEKVMEKFTSWHNRQVQSFNTDIVATKYAPEFDTLERMGREFAQLSESKYPDATAIALHSKENPYAEYIKTALNISNINDYAKLNNANRAIDATVSHAWNSASNLFKRMKGVDQKTLDEINDTFNKVGFKSVFKDAEAFLVANHTADSAVLSRWIRNAQSVLGTVFLRLDSLHAFNNKLGSIIMTSSELRHLKTAIAEGNTEVAGKLAQLSNVKLPGVDQEMFAPAKLMSNAYRNLFSSPELRARAVAEGYVPSDITEAFKVIDTLSLRGNETPKQLNALLQSAVDRAKGLVSVGERVTGNRWVEFANRFVSYDVMRQVTDVAVEAGVMTAKEAGSYINTFVGRTQVILNAAQRPMAFQGPIGMAMGLFQSYQFNLFQQMFRYIGDGGGKTLAVMGGLQGSFYGMHGVPGFRFLNESIVGLAAGNPEHKDITSGSTGAFNKDLAEFLLYGAPSKLLNTALYTRGDLTPQHPTVLPSSIADLPVVNMYSRIFNNMFTAMDRMAEGANMKEVFLSALEHNSFNRPLKGLAQVARGMSDGEVKSTYRNGEFLAANDLWSLATLARLSGASPLDEAIQRDFKYRTNAYQRHDSDRRASAAEALRLSMMNNNIPSDQQLDRALDIYVNSGADITRWNSWMLDQQERATIPEAERMVRSLKEPYAIRMQQLMGGM